MPDRFRGDESDDGSYSDDSRNSEGREVEKTTDETPLGHLVKSDKFQATTAVVIIICTVSMAIETDFCRDCSFWWWWNSAILLYFCVELGLRIAYYRFGFFSCGGENRSDAFWNYFDLSIVLVCVLADWVEPLISNSAGESGLNILRIFRIFRILRTLRVLRIFKSFSQLNKLAEGLLVSLGTVFWIALLMFMVMLIFAIILTDTAGNQAKIAEQPGDLFYDDRESVLTYWGSVGHSLITLFQILTLDDWVHVTQMVDHQLPPLWFVFFLYVFTMGFAMLSLLTGVVAEHMTEVSTEAKNEEEQEIDDQFKTFLDKELPKRALVAANSPKARKAGATLGTNELNIEALEEFVSDVEVQKALKIYEVSIEPEEANEFWDCLDRDGDGKVSVSELKNGLMRLRSELQPKDMLRLRYAAERVTRELEGGQGRAATTRKLEEIKLDLSEVETRMESMGKNLRDFMKFTQENSGAMMRKSCNRVAACA